MLALGFGLDPGSSLSWIGTDWCGNGPKKDAVSAGGCPLLSKGSSAWGLVNWNHIWLSKTLSLLTSAEVVDFQGNWKSAWLDQHWLGMPLSKVGLHRTTNIFHAGNAFTGHQIAEDVPEDNCNGYSCKFSFTTHRLSQSLVLEAVVGLLSCVLGPAEMQMMSHLEQNKNL